MKNSILLLGTLLLFCCCNSPNNKVKSNDNKTSSPIVSNKNYTINKISGNEYNILKNKTFESNLKDTAILKKEKGKITINLDNGEKVIFRDSLCGSYDTEKKCHNYIGYLPETNSYIIMIKYYESSQVVLINN